MNTTKRIADIMSKVLLWFCGFFIVASTVICFWYDNGLGAFAVVTWVLIITGVVAVSLSQLEAKSINRSFYPDELETLEEYDRIVEEKKKGE